MAKRLKVTVTVEDDILVRPPAQAGHRGALLRRPVRERRPSTRSQCRGGSSSKRRPRHGTLFVAACPSKLAPNTQNVRIGSDDSKAHCRVVTRRPLAGTAVVTMVWNATVRSKDSRYPVAP
jgi:hypothetical protein